MQHLQRLLDDSEFEEGSRERRAREAVKSLFRQVQGIQFPPPVEEPGQLRVLHSLEKESLAPGFVKQIGHLKRKISKFLRPKKLLEKTLDGISFLLVVEEYLRIFNKGESLTLSGIVQRTEAEERKFLVSHMQDWVDYYFEVNFLKKDLVEKGVAKLIEMASEDHRDFQFETLQQSFDYFCAGLRAKEEREKTVRLKLLGKAVENIQSAYPQLEGAEVLQKVLEDESLQGKLFELSEVFETVVEAALEQEKQRDRARVDFLKDKLQKQDSDRVFAQTRLEELESENRGWKQQLAQLGEDNQVLRVKLNAQKGELEKLRKINSGESSSHVQLEVLMQSNAELDQKNQELRRQLQHFQVPGQGAESPGESRNLAHLLHSQTLTEETLLRENDTLRRRVEELLLQKGGLSAGDARGVFKKARSAEK